jgi:predicted nucleotidyltransferase
MTNYRGHNLVSFGLIQQPMQGAQRPLPVSSSDPPSFAGEQKRLFRGVLRAMNERAVPYVVSGAFALQQHTGIWRDTKDLDLFIPPESVPRALEYLREEGFQTAVLDPVWLAKAHHDDYYVDVITGMSNAVITVDLSWVERGRRALVLGVPTRVLAAEELFASKLFVTRRERFDSADTCHIIFGTKGNMDWARVLEIAGDHWQMVFWTLVLYGYIYPAHTHYVPKELWHDLTERFLHTVDHPDPQAEFRGSLIDENMFAIDVREWGLPDVLQRYRDRRAPKIPTDPLEPAA